VATGSDREWLDTPGVPVDARMVLLEMLNEVMEEIARQEAANSHFDERTNRLAS
jgi:hypothetical protein